MADRRDIPLALYVHIPWCERKCPYCDFNSHERYDPADQLDYVGALIHDLELQLEGFNTPPLHSIFIGGGTPSLFSGEAIATLMEGIDKRWPIGSSTEVTLEANPGSAEAARFAAYRAAGINRLSLGIQSFDDHHLQSLGRVHSAAQAQAAVTQADRHFSRFNIDLMHGLPNQTPEQAVADLRQALASGSGHISWYQLTVEPNTAFWSRPPRLPGDDLLADIQDAGAHELSQAGLNQYEVSAWALRNQEAQHNLNYWRFGDYLGIGAGAHGKLSRPEGSIERTQRTRAPADYLSAIKERQPPRRNTIPATELPVEFMLNALRLREGVPLQLFESRTGLSTESVARIIDDLQSRGLLSVQGGVLRTTPTGFNFLNDVLARFIPPGHRASAIPLLEE
ncbi:MAG: radical SAM family heme chaperone HemW [Cellvibrionales bacterium]|jgi:oxygen-independent coproporphyrinogen-3 oxidase